MYVQTCEGICTFSDVCALCETTVISGMYIIIVQFDILHIFHLSMSLCPSQFTVSHDVLDSEAKRA